jgi:phytoene/squalene synthetase
MRREQPMGFDADVTACAALVEKGDPARFRTVMAAPLAAREILFPLYAFNVEVSRAPWVTQEPMIAEMRLQWWRDALEEIANGTPVRRHEITTPLARAITPGDARLLDELVAARRWDIYRDPFGDAAHFADYINQTAGHLMWVAATCLGPADEETVRNAACAAGVANWLRACPELEARGRVPLVDGTPEGVRLLAQSATQRLGTARRNRKKVSAAARPALYPVADAAKVLKVAIATPGRVASGDLPQPSPLTRMSLALAALAGRW